jgi:hypothetical protein
MDRTAWAWRWHRVSLFCGLFAASAQAQEPSRRPIDGIMDNSFLIEEAYNQESGIVQHILTGTYSFNRFYGDALRRGDLAFTQEWPVFSQTHQFSYTIPYSFVRDGRLSLHGLGDVLLNYRLQAFFDQKSLTAFAPRFSLLLPTGNRTRNLGNGTPGYQWNLPFSTTFGDRWFAHANGGLTYVPSVGVRGDRHLLGENLGASAIYCANQRLHFMLEWVAVWNESLDDRDLIGRDVVSLISPGLRYAFNLREETQLVLGVGLPIGLTRSSPELGVLVYLSFEHRMFGSKAAP